MPFMQKQIYKGMYFEIDTTHGTEIVPSDVIGRTCGTDVSAFLDYLEGEPLNEDEVIECQDGWLARMSAPGYMDCTSWGVYNSELEAIEHLEEMFGEDEEESDSSEIDTLIDSLGDFTRAYIVAALWSSNDESTPQGGEPMDANYSIEDIAPESMREIIEECKAFQEQYKPLLEQAYSLYISRDGYTGEALAGHDFWLTRNRHGVGFWDRKELEVILPSGETLGDALTKASQALGELSPYVGDDGKIYF